MKKLILLLSFLIILTGCTSGGGYQVTNAIGETSTPGMLAMTYDNFNGTKFGDFYPVAPGETVEFLVNVETLDGSLTIYVTPESDENMIVYKAEDIQTSEFSFIIDDPGEYALYLSADDHKGGYVIQVTRSMN